MQLPFQPLEGNKVRLEPLALSHVPALQQAVTDGNLWELWYTSVPHPDNMQAYVERALAQQTQASAIAFAVRCLNTGEIVGCSRICNIVPNDRRMEIGYTWYAKRAQRTGINTETKLLLLGLCFEALNAIAVEFRTHWHNRVSREAIARLGARQDGVLRNHKILADGSIRDTVVFSILDREWPVVQRDLQFRLSRTSGV